MIGERLPRAEDVELIQGRSTYLDDLRLPGMLHAAFVRSPLPHAQIVSVDASEARLIDGVAVVLTSADLDNVALETVPPPGVVGVRVGPLASGKVRFAGDPVAVVVATSRRTAEDVAELVVVDYDPLPPVATIDQALDASRPPLWTEYGSNVVWSERRQFGDVDGVFGSATKIVSVELDSPRVGHVPMECGGCLAAFQAGSLDIWAGTQSPNALRTAVATAFGLQVSRVRVRTPRIGGSFGQKGLYRREDLAVVAAAQSVGRPVKWVEDRVENLLSAGQAREERFKVDAAIDDSGRLLGLRVSMVLNQGAYPTALPRSGTVRQIRTLIPSAYRLEALDFKATIIASNKASYLTYRGPWAAETWVRERVLDIIAAEVRIDPVEIRRRNLVTPEDQPRRMVTGPTLSGVTLRRGLDIVEHHFDFAAFRERQKSERLSGRLWGVGVACFLEPAPGPPDYRSSMTGVTTLATPLPSSQTNGRQPAGGKPAMARLEIDGTLRIVIAESPSGQGHRTAFAQVASEVLRVDPAQVSVVSGDTAVAPFTPFGTGGSSAAHMTGGAVGAAAQGIADKIMRIAAHLLEADIADLEIEGGAVRVRGTPSKALSFAEVARTAWLTPDRLPPGEQPGLEVTAWFANRDCGWSQGTHLCEVEIDPNTALVRITRYLVVEDCGRVINPSIVLGQIRGGVAQGIGAVLYEHAAFDDDGNPLATSFMDYLLPTAWEIPAIEVVHIEDDALHPGSGLSARGVGEGGTIGAMAAVLNAVADALGGGDSVRSRFVPPSLIWRLLEQRTLLGSPLMQSTASATLGPS